MIWPLGMVNVRLKRLKRMTADFLTWDYQDATKLYGIGRYGSDSYEIFFKHNYTVKPTDKELKRYLEEEVFRQPNWDHYSDLPSPQAYMEMT